MKPIDRGQRGGLPRAETYVVRREALGAYVFDTVKRRVLRLDEPSVRAVEATAAGQAVSGLPREVRAFFDEAGRPRYTRVDPLARLATAPAPLALAAPNRIYLELTRRCPARCEACYNAAGTRLPDELDVDRWEALIDELAGLGVFEFRFTGGEPTTHPRFLELVDRALATGRYVSIGTCALMPREILEGLAVRPLDEIIVSYHGPAPVHDAFTGRPGSHARTLAVLEHLTAAGRGLRLNLTLTRTTRGTVEDAFRLADRLGIRTINLIHARPVGRGRDRGTCLTAAENYEHMRRIADFRGRYRVRVMTDFDLLRSDDDPPARHAITDRRTSCPAGREFAFISPEGYVFPCGVAPVAHVSAMSPAEQAVFVAGSVTERPFLEIWHTSPTWAPYRDLNLCKPDECRSCRFWGRKCYGSCPPAAFVTTGSLAGRDPCCPLTFIDDTGA